MNTSEIRELSTKELIERIENEKNMLTKMKLNHAVSPLDNPMKLRFARKNIARLLTELKKRELAEKQ
ncbi:MAG: 50S ribosomal protein L29 [Bacteroidales bacterium]|jgi:large subunit ribosomal protein L29|nr:50S ribosomal protein L29 [Bacteroidales bacterium]